MIDFEKQLSVQRAENLIRKELEWDKWVKEIPTINFPKEWGIKIIPPFGGALARFRVQYNDREISVYLDCYELIGCFDGPYWEMYPYGDDIYRVGINNTEELITRIWEELNDEHKE